jgi:hypothetical protein
VGRKQGQINRSRKQEQEAGADKQGQITEGRKQEQTAASCNIGGSKQPQVKNRYKKNKNKNF